MCVSRTPRRPGREDGDEDGEAAAARKRGRTAATIVVVGWRWGVVGATSVASVAVACCRLLPIVVTRRRRRRIKRPLSLLASCVLRLVSDFFLLFLVRYPQVY